MSRKPKHSVKQRIMMEIGFHNHYNYFANRRGCLGTRIEAADRLAEVIGRYAAAGDQITKPDLDLIDIAKLVARFEFSHTSVARTWEACSLIIAAHVTAAEYPSGYTRDAYLDEQAELLYREFSSILYVTA